MENLAAKIEACLFVATKPLLFKELARITESAESEVASAVTALAQLRNVDSSGIHVVTLEDSVQLVTSPAWSDTVARLAKAELAPELTQPSLEALTIIAYRGPVTRAEIEAIRGVNCSVILRNLLLRGLVEERDDKVKLQPVYTLSSETLRFLGLHSVAELPDFNTLHANAHIDKLLAAVMVPVDQKPL